MAFFAGLGVAIVNAIAAGITALKSVTLAQVLSFVALSAVTTGLGVITNLLFAPRPKGVGPNAVRTVRASSIPAQWIMGRRRVGGVLCFMHVNSPDTDDQDDGGVFLSYPNNDVYAHMVFVLGKGAMESVEGMWIDGTYVALEWRSRGHTPQRGYQPGETPSGSIRDVPGYLVPSATEGPASIYRQKVWVKPYLNADGVLAPELHANTTVPQGNAADGRLKVLADFTPKAPADQSPVEKAWGSDRAMHDLAYVYVIIRRPDYISGGRLKIERNPFSGGFPELQFLAKGNRITWPGQLTPAWTENAAAWRHWVMTAQPTDNWRYIDPRLIDAASFASALASSAENPMEVLPEQFADYPTDDIRFAANGILRADDDQEAIFDALDFAWQGAVVYHAGRYYFRPGVDRGVQRIIHPQDLAGPIGVLAAPPLQNRVNAVTLQLDQSKEHDWAETPLNDYEDLAAQRLDGYDDVDADGNPIRVPVRLNKDLGRAAFVNSPIRGAAIMGIQLKRARLYQQYTVPLFFPDDNLADVQEKLALKALDVIQVASDPEHGFTNKLMRIISAETSTQGGLAKVLHCEEYDPTIYDDEVVLPPLKDRTPHLPEIDVFGPPQQVTVQAETEEREDCSLAHFLAFAWFPQHAWTEIAIRPQASPHTDPDFTSHVVVGNAARIPITPGVWEYRLRHLADANLSNPSAWTAVRAVTVAPDTRVVDAAATTCTPLPGGFALVWPVVTDPCYERTEVEMTPENRDDWDVVGTIHGSVFLKLDMGARKTVRLRLRHFARGTGLPGSYSPEETCTTGETCEGGKIVSVDTSGDLLNLLFTAGPWALCAANIAGLSSLLSGLPGLTPGATYNFRIRAVNAVGVSAPSNVVTVTIPNP